MTRDNVDTKLASPGPGPQQPRHHHGPRPRPGATPPGPAPASDGSVRPVSGARAGARTAAHGSSGQSSSGQGLQMWSLQGKFVIHFILHFIFYPVLLILCHVQIMLAIIAS